MIQETKAILKGDKAFGIFYVWSGCVFIACALLLYFFTEQLGWQMLSRGMAILGMYSIIKGIIVFGLSKQRLDFYKSKSALNSNDIENEIQYARYRVQKKEVNRRRYVYILIIGSSIAVLSVFTDYRALAISTLVPIVLYAALEFSVCLLTEFRLWEYIRRLEKVQ